MTVKSDYRKAKKSARRSAVGVVGLLVMWALAHVAPAVVVGAFAMVLCIYLWGR